MSLDCARYQMEDDCIFHALRRYADRVLKGESQELAVGHKGVFVKHAHNCLERRFTEACDQYKQAATELDWASPLRMGRGWCGHDTISLCNASVQFNVQVNGNHFCFGADISRHAQLCEVVGPLLWEDLAPAVPPAAKHSAAPPTPCLCSMQLTLHQPCAPQNNMERYFALPSLIEPAFMEVMAGNHYCASKFTRKSPFEWLLGGLIDKLRCRGGVDDRLIVCIEVAMFTQEHCPRVALLTASELCVLNPSELLPRSHTEEYMVCAPQLGSLPGGLLLFTNGALCEWAAVDLAMHAPPPPLAELFLLVAQRWKEWRQVVFRVLSFFSEDPYIVCDVSTGILPVMDALGPFLAREISLLLESTQRCSNGMQAPVGDAHLDEQDLLARQVLCAIDTSTAILLDGLQKSALQSSLGEMQCMLRHLHNSAHEFLAEANKRRYFLMGVDAFLADCQHSGATRSLCEPVGLAEHLFKPASHGPVAQVVQTVENLVRVTRDTKATLCNPQNPIVTRVVNADPCASLGKRKRFY